MQFSVSRDAHGKHRYTTFTIVLAAAALWMLPRCASGAITPSITGVSNPVVVGNSFNITGSGFTAGSVANFFVATASGAVNFGPLKPSAHSSTSLTVPVPVSKVTTLGQGVVSIVVVNTDQGFTQSNAVTAQLFGDTAAGFPNLLKIDGVALAATSTDPSYATDNVETVVMHGHKVTLDGMGFDTAHGVAIDLFCDCPGGKIPTIFLAPGNPGLTATALSFTLPASAVTGPGSFVISNRGAKGDYARKSNAVSVVVGARVTVSAVGQIGCALTVNGSGFAVTGAARPPLTVINLFNRQSGAVVNLGGLAAGGAKLPIDVASANQFTLDLAGIGIQVGPSYVQVLNPPFVPFSSSGDTAKAAFTAAGCQAAWPMFHANPRRTGQSAYSTAADTGAMKWKFTTGYIVESSPALGEDGTIYVGSLDSKLYAIKPDGTQRWSFKTANAVVSSPAVGADSTIYVGSEDGNLYAIKPDGSLKWKFNTGKEVLSSPVVAVGGTIYVGSYDHNLYAINPDGTQRWKFPTGDTLESSPAVGTDGTIYVGSDDHNLYAINPDGTQKWKFVTGQAVASSPAVGADGTIYVGSFDFHLYAINPDGSQKWKFSLPGVNSSPAIGADGTIYIGAYDDNLYAVNPDGTQKWKFAAGDQINFSSPAVGADGTIYVGSLDHNLYAINPDGTQKWKFATGDTVQSSPAIGADGTIYIGSEDDNLYAVH